MSKHIDTLLKSRDDKVSRDDLKTESMNASWRV